MKRTVSSKKRRHSAAEMAKRIDLAAAYRLVALYGMDEMIANHISARVPGKEGVFYINPYGMLYEQMHASCFIELDLDGNVVYNPTEYGINQAGFVLHSLLGASGWNAPPDSRQRDWLIATLFWAPMTMVFLSVPAMRLALSAPLDLRSNWIFRMTEDVDARAEGGGALNGPAFGYCPTFRRDQVP